MYRQWYCPEMPEWNMEKYRFYVDLPGDFWERGSLLRYLRSRDIRVSGSTARYNAMQYTAVWYKNNGTEEPEVTRHTGGWRYDTV
jgi:hypothetical protein